MEAQMPKRNEHITCRVLSTYETRRFEYFMKERNLDSRSIYFGMAISNDGIKQLVDHMINHGKLRIHLLLH